MHAVHMHAVHYSPLSSLTNRCCGLQAIKYCANSPLARIGAQVPAWLAPMTDKQSLLPARAGRID
jgi:hypothetical protein